MILNYYDNPNCFNNYKKQIIYPINKEDKEFSQKLIILNSEGVDEYDFSFDFFSSQIYYTKEIEEENDEENDEANDEESEEENIYKKGFVCNGLCIKRRNYSDILLDPDFKEETEIDYDNENSRYKYYSCIYNNIIETAKIEVEIYSDKKCKNKEDNYTFYGEDTCWNINEEDLSFRPLYFEDSDKKIYYHPYYSNDCTTNTFSFIQPNKNYLKCNNKCQENIIDILGNYYKCIFISGDKYINLKKILYLYLFLLFEIL